MNHASLPCPHCGEPVVVQYGLRRLPFRCRHCLRDCALPLRSRVAGVLVVLAVTTATILLLKFLGLDKASTFAGIGALLAVFLGGVLVATFLAARVSRATGTHLVKVGE